MLFECIDAIEEYKKILLDKEFITGTEDTKPDSGKINYLTNTLAQMLKNQNESTAKLLKNSSGSGPKPSQPFLHLSRMILILLYLVTFGPDSNTLLKSAITMLRNWNG